MYSIVFGNDTVAIVFLNQYEIQNQLFVTDTALTEAIFHSQMDRTISCTMFAKYLRITRLRMDPTTTGRRIRKKLSIGGKIAAIPLLNSVKKLDAASDGEEEVRQGGSMGCRVVFSSCQECNSHAAGIPFHSIPPRGSSFVGSHEVPRRSFSPDHRSILRRPFQSDARARSGSRDRSLAFG